MAVLVNISQFMCLGRFSAVTFQVGQGRGAEGPLPFLDSGALGLLGGAEPSQSMSLCRASAVT